mgnify:CR=1 FL=1
MMITEVMKISEPPYTNRGVIRQKEELSALIDWCQITIKEVPLEAVIAVSYTHLTLPTKLEV